MCLLSACCSVVFTLFIEVILAVHLSNHYGIPHNMLGIYFLLAASTYLVGAPLSAYASKIVNRRYVIMGAFFLMSVVCTIQGPSALLGLEDSLPLVTVGVTMVGFCLSLALVPILSELIEILEATDLYEKSDISDVTAGLFNSMFNLGNLIAPLLGGLLNEKFGYKLTCDFMAIASFVYAIVFYLTMIFRRKLY
jgi:predicted MFS family arabinose efflux permease